MKKIARISMAALVLMGATLAGCSKSEAQQPEIKDTIVTVTTTIGLGKNDATKALDIDYVNKKVEKTFADGEQVALVYEKEDGNKTRAVATAENISTDGKSANFTFTLVNPKAAQTVSYHYPAHRVDDAGILSIPIENQDGTLSDVKLFDYAYAEGALSGTALPASIELENQFAIVAFTLKDNTINPAPDITGNITGMTINDGSNEYYINRAAAAGPIYVVMMPFADKNLTITATDGARNYYKTLSSKTYAANNFYQQGLKMLQDEKAGNGFTINSLGKKVKFAPGNLQATYTDGTWTWAFAEHQWDFIGGWDGSNVGVKTSNNHIGNDGTLPANGTVDLFGWVGASSNWTGVVQYGLTPSVATGQVDGYGSVAGENLKSDWGNVGITNGSGSTWRSLTGGAQGEWNYLFNHASGAIVNGTTDARYTYAIINTGSTSVNGMILFPDGCIIHASSATRWGDINQAGFYLTECTVAEWQHLESLGCVFLPAAGYRVDSDLSYVTSTVREANGIGYYWASTSPSNNNASAFCVYFEYEEAKRESAGDFGRCAGFSVRLVREIE